MGHDDERHHVASTDTERRVSGEKIRPHGEDWASRGEKGAEKPDVSRVGRGCPEWEYPVEMRRGKQGAMLGWGP